MKSSQDKLVSRHETLEKQPRGKIHSMIVLQNITTGLLLCSGRKLGSVIFTV